MAAPITIRTPAGDEILELPAERIETEHTQGSGCTLSAAICARLARGEGLRDAIRGAKQYVSAALRGAYATGRGRGTLDHFGAGSFTGTAFPPHQQS